jgi:putative copper export protein/methionine-rich copper-binding protein CopC
MRRRALWSGALALALLVPARARAHGHLERARPAAGARLAAPPRELRLTFTETPALAFTRLELLDASGATIALAPPTLAADAPRTVVSSVGATLTAGTYTVVWQMAGDDGHLTRGRFTFTVIGTPHDSASATPPRGEAAGAVTARGRTPVPATHRAVPADESTFDAESPAYVVIRWAQFVALVVVIGGATFACVVLPRLRRRIPGSPFPADASARAARLARWGVAGVAATAVARFLAQSYAMHGAGAMTDPALMGAMLSRTVWGWGWLLQVAGVLAAWLGLRQVAAARATGWTTVALGAVLLACTPALSGHAASAPRWPALAVAADALHVLGAGGWLGSLLFVVAAGVPAALQRGPSDRGRAVADLVNAFSPTALACASLVAVTGVVAAWAHLGRLDALWRTTYGKTLLVKLAVLAVVTLTGAYNWLRVRPSLGDDASVARQRRSATAELAVGAVVLAVTAVLVATPTPMDEASAPAVSVISTGAGS